MKSVTSRIRRSPRTASALAFGTGTLVLQHFAWRTDARMNGLIPCLTIAAGLVHAVAGAITGPRLMDGAHTRTPSQAALLGAGTSLLALVLFAPLFTVFLFATDIHPAGTLSYTAFPLLIAVFAFLADGWALLVVSIGIGLILHRVATH
jgi:protein-S-isoprenylcysteine O-methyltransferase Ste14